MSKPGASHKLPLTANDLIARGECPICRGRARSHFHDQPYDAATTIHHYRCEACGLIYMDPVPTQDWYNRLYGEEFWQVKSIETPSGDLWTNDKQWHKSLARAEKYLQLLRQEAPGTPINTVLEIGASFGLIGTAIADACGGRAFGVEPNHAARDFAARAAGMTMIAETAAGLDAWKPDAPVDLVIFSHVLENIVDIHGTLAAVHRKLRSGALLLIETPNIDWQPSMSIYHPYCFSAAALRILLAESGFRVRRELRSGRPASMVVPRYLTMLAESTSAPLAVERPQTSGNVSVAKSRHMVYKAFYRLLFGPIDAAICSRRYHTTPFLRQRIARLRTNLSRVQAGR